jgi:hypothetical protein
LVARYGDMCNLFDLPGTGFRDNLTHKLDVLRQRCREVGRDYNEIEKTTATFVELGEDRQAGLKDLLDHIRELAAVGIDQAIVGPRGPWDDDTLDAVASIVDEVHDIPSSSDRADP